jgi:hypothetical protein
VSAFRVSAIGFGIPRGFAALAIAADQIAASSPADFIC